MACALASACGTRSGAAASGATAAAQAWEQPVPKAQCGPADVPEPALQGQVTLLERASGFQGTHCNLELVGQWAGEGASWMQASLGDCAYYDQAVGMFGDSEVIPRAHHQHPGTVVIDATDSSHPVASEYLTSASMIDPWESLKVNEKRKLLAGVFGAQGQGGPQFDVYDIAADCRHPQLLASVTLSDSTLAGHEGNFSPDGMTYYGADNSHNIWYAIDLADPARPRLIAEFKPQVSNVHGLSLSTDGNRGYFVQASVPSPVYQPGAAPANGFYIFDTSDVQQRRPNPELRLISQAQWSDGAQAQHTLPFFIHGHAYLLALDEWGAAGSGSAATWAQACAQGMPPYGFARIFDIGDETRPSLVSKLMLQTHDPANCWDVIGDTSENLNFGYDSHYCTVDDADDAQIAACSYFESGLRVFDIRDPHHPKEIAYYNPPARPGYQAGSMYDITGVCGSADWTSAQPRIRRDRGEIWFTSQCNGFQIVKFSNGVLPAATAKSKTSS
ncbi:MAG TPA: hypothetical protein VHE37_15030 [Nevskiaceae bacterium]|nr:hypothetical protein [Nevskiaceae bacterium]